MPYIFGLLFLVIFWNLIKRFVFPNLQNTAAYNDLVSETEEQTGEKANLSDAKALSYANKLHSALGYLDDDESLAKWVFWRLNNDADLYLVQAKYQGQYGEDLAAWMQTFNTSPYSYNDGSKEMINEILRKKGLKYRF